MLSKKISLTPSQIKVFQSDKKYTAFVAGMGAGKSYTMGLVAVQQCAHASTCVAGIYEKDHFLIKRVAMPNVMYWLSELGYVGKPNLQDSMIYTSSSGIGDFIFKTMDNPEALIGFETSVALFDELDTLPLLKAEEIWTKAHGRNRLQPKGVDESLLVNGEYVNKYYVFTTPEGYNFCYRYFHNKNDPDILEVQASSAENPAATKAWLEAQIKTYGPNKARAYVHGEYVNLAASSVYDAYDRELHRSVDEIQPHDTLHIGMDFNVNKQCAVVFVRRNSNEFHAVHEEVDVKDTPTMVSIIKSKWPNHEIIIYPDASGTSRKTVNASISDISLLKKAGFQIKAPKKNPYIKDRVQAMQNSFINKRQFINYNNCPTYDECLRNQPYNDKGEPEKKSGYDHCNDAAGYAINTIMPIQARNLFNLPISFVT